MAKLGHCGNDCCVNDSVCEFINLTSTDRVIYTNASPFPVNGTILVENPSNLETVEINLDGTSYFVPPNSSRAVTSYFDSIILSSSNDINGVKYSFSINYKF